jgi:hypothetical protein
MNEQMREEHFRRIESEAARAMYERLCDACDQRPGGMSPAEQMMVADIAYEEQVKQMLMDDIVKRGLGQERYNGRQKYYQENRSPAQYRAFCDQQRKQLAELRLTPASRKAEQIQIEDDFDAFE